MPTRSRAHKRNDIRYTAATSRRVGAAARIAPAVLAAGTAAWMLSTNGAPAGHAGAPIDGYVTCSACHSGGSAEGGEGTSFHVSASVPEFTPGSPIEVTVTMDEPGQAYYAPGFQLTAVSGDSFVGAFEIADEDHTQFAPASGGGVDDRYVTHRAPNENTRSWTVVWDSGETDTDVAFYATGLSRFGGIVYRDSLVVPRASSVGGEDEGLELPSFTALYANYPNPFNRETLVPFELSEAAAIRLSVFDVAGREVAVLASGWFPAGKHQRAFRADRIPTGIYVYKLSGPAGEHARKMLHIR